MTRDRQPKRLASNLMLAAVTLVVSLLAAETATRVLYPVPLHPTDTYLAASGNNTPRLRARTRARHEDPRFDVPVSINSHGLRDDEITYQKPSGERRVLCLGDSFTFGQGLTLEETFVEVAESQLPKGWRCINTGVPGWGTADELDYLVHHGFRYEPDIVVVCFYRNDIRDNRWRGTYRLGEDGKPYRVAPFDGYGGEGSPKGNPALDEIFSKRNSAKPADEYEAGWWVRNCNLCRIARQAASRTLRAVSRDDQPTAEFEEQLRDERPLTAGLLAEMTRECAERGIPTIILLMPSLEQVTAGDVADLRDELHDIAARPEELGASVVNLAPGLRSAGGEKAYFPEDIHINALGHQVVGRELADAIRRVLGNGVGDR